MVIISITILFYSEHKRKDKKRNQRNKKPKKKKNGTKIGDKISHHLLKLSVEIFFVKEKNTTKIKIKKNLHPGLECTN